MFLRRNPQGKKNKTWDDDAFVSHIGDKITMISEEGKMCRLFVCIPPQLIPVFSRLGIVAWKGDSLRSGYALRIGGKEVELDREVLASDLPIVSGLAAGPCDRSTTCSPPLSPRHPSSVAPRESTDTPTMPPPAPRAGFVSPASFYAVPPKAKLKGPL
jgi:DNA repair and recombination protein RAD54B